MVSDQIPSGRALECILKDYVRVYEEELVIDEAVRIYCKLATEDGVRLDGLARELGTEPKTIAKVFRQYDSDDTGVISAKQLLATVRLLNSVLGECDGCYELVGGDDGAFACSSCDFVLCAECYTDRGELHPEHAEFESLHEVEIRESSGPGDIPVGTGRHFVAEVGKLFADPDGDGDGRMSSDEFEAYCIKDEWEPEFIKFALSCDFDGDGRVSRREAVYLLTGLAMVRACNECNDLSFISEGKLMSCLECTADYDVCVTCWIAGRRSHSHERFEVVKPFQLRNVGLYYRHSHDDVWTVAVGKPNTWQGYKPFIGDKVATTAKLGAPMPARVAPPPPPAPAPASVPAPTPARAPQAQRRPVARPVRAAPSSLETFGSASASSTRCSRTFREIASCLYIHSMIVDKQE